MPNLKPPPVGKRERVIPEDELSVILQAVDANFGKLIQFVCFTGARPQEAVAAHQRNLQGDRLVWMAGQAPKGKSPRIIYLNEKPLSLINSEGYLLTNSRGKPWTSNAVRIRFKR